MRNPFKALNQDHAWIQVGGISYEEVITATGLGGLSIYGDVPVLGAYYRMLAGDRQISSRVLKRLDLRSSWLRMASWEDAKQYCAPTGEARVEFFRTFGIHAVDQVALESFYLTHARPTSLPCDQTTITTPEYVEANLKYTTLLNG